MSDVEACHVDGIGGGSVEVAVRGRIKEIPVEQEGSILGLVTNKILSYNHNCYSCSSEVLLGTSVNHAKLCPIDFPRADVRTHIANDR